MARAARARHWSVLAVLTLLALAVPAPVLPLLDGIPLTSVEEAAGLLVVGALVLVRPRASRLAGAAVLLGASALLLKLCLLVVPGPGLAACYVIAADAAAGECERSFSAPFSNDITRRDPAIDFGKRGNPAEPALTVEDSNWHLGAVNSSEFNFYTEGRPDAERRYRLPLRVAWRGAIQRPARDEVRLHYVGEGRLVVGGVLHELPPSYDAPSVVVVPARGGDLALDLAWTPTAGSTGPYAMARLLDGNGDSVQPRDVGGAVAALGLAASALLVLALAGAAIAVALALGLLSSAAAVLGVAAVPVATAVALLALRGSVGVDEGLLRALVLPLVLALCVVRLWTSRRHAALGAVVSACLLGAALVQATTGTLDPHAVTVRAGGDDFLTYESLGRSMLEEGSLRGGEDVFVYSPGFRYTLAAQHLLFGDGDTAISLLAIVGLIGALWFAIETLVLSRLTSGAVLDALRRPGLSRRPVLAGLAGAVAAVAVPAALLSSAEVVKGGFILLSEYPTWILMLVGIPLLLTARSLAAASAAVALLSVAFVHRGDQGVGIAAVVLVGAWTLVSRGRTPRERLAAAAVVLGPGLLIGLLPAVHNVVYGGRLVLLAQTPKLPVNFPLPPRDLLDLDEPRVQSVLVDQLAGVLATPRAAGELSTAFQGSVRAVQVALVLLLVVVLVRRIRAVRRQLLLLLIPVGYLVPHVFIQVYVYYPRHVVAGYLAGGVVLLAIAGCALSRAAAAPLARRAASRPAARAGAAT